MNSHEKALENVVSQAVLHLHVELSRVGTALVDRRERNILFSHNALQYVDERMLGRMADLSLSSGPGIVHEYRLDGLTVFTEALDERHVFMVLGKQIEAKPVNRFLSQLRNILLTIAL